VVISDVGMPDENGYALIRAIRDQEQSNSSNVAIAMSGFAGREDKGLCGQVLMHRGGP
jgi:CheY-like chemotaxis protein